MTPGRSFSFLVLPTTFSDAIALPEELNLHSTLHIIANGGAREMAEPASRKDFQQLVQKLLPGAGVHFIEKGMVVRDMVQTAIRAGATVIAAGGGDGTVNSVAAELVGTKVTLGVLPLGTLNHFAKDAGIPLVIEDALAVLRDGEIMSVDVGRVADRIFLNNSGLGLYPDMVYNREQRQKKGASKWPSVVVESARAFRRYRLLRLRVVADGKALERRTPVVFVGNNEYSMEGTIAAQRTSLVGGKLCLYIPCAQKRLSLVWFSLRAFFGSPKAGVDFDRIIATDFTIETRHKKMRVSIDGEVVVLSTPLRYQIEPLALRVLVPTEAVRNANASSAQLAAGH
ncbi:MAG: diacylglycerol kinase family protein [Gemmatimonadaceae bacterium]